MTDQDPGTTCYYLTPLGTNYSIDELMLYTPEDRPMIRIPFHDRLDSPASSQRKADIDLIVTALNAYHNGRSRTMDDGTNGNRQDIDVHELLAGRRQIAHIWGIDDVQAERPDLNDDDAWTVLQACERHLDSNYGLTWDTIEITADELFPVNEANHEEDQL